MIQKLDEIKAIDPASVRFAGPDDITLGDLLRLLDGDVIRPLVFYYDGRAVKHGYHVTEVKAGQFAALDCGANPDS